MTKQDAAAIGRSVHQARLVNDPAYRQAFGQRIHQGRLRAKRMRERTVARTVTRTYKHTGRYSTIALSIQRVNKAIYGLQEKRAALLRAQTIINEQ